MEKRVKLLPTMMPNFLPTEGLVGDETTSSPRIAVSSLTADEAAEYGELMKQTFIKHWQKKRRHGKD